MTVPWLVITALITLLTLAVLSVIVLSLAVILTLAIILSVLAFPVLALTVITALIALLTLAILSPIILPLAVILTLTVILSALTFPMLRILTAVPVLTALLMESLRLTLTTASMLAVLLISLPGLTFTTAPMLTALLMESLWLTLSTASMLAVLLIKALRLTFSTASMLTALLTGIFRLTLSAASMLIFPLEMPLRLTVLAAIVPALAAFLMRIFMTPVLTTASPARTVLMALFTFLNLLRLFLLQTFQLLQFLFGKFHIIFFATSPLKSKPVHLILADLFLISYIHHYLDQLTEHINALHLSFQSVIGGNIIADTGQPAVQFLVSLFLILQTAHQSAADAGNLGRIQREILFLCHLNRHRNKVR